nr:MAG TPA: hypothetical protein [Caudoviricetes sp.]
MASSRVDYLNRSGVIGSNPSSTVDSKSLSFDIQSTTNGTYWSPNKFIQIPGGEPATVPLEQLVSQLNKSVGLPDDNQTHHNILETYSKYYNRYKIPNPNIALQKGFGHVFFVRPSCNLLDNNYRLLPELQSNEEFRHIAEASPWVLRNLVASNGQNHDFFLLLSNFAQSFSLSDEVLATNTYGQSYTGYKIAYGKTLNESRSSGNFNIQFGDDRNLHLYQTLKAWVSYISGCYRGTIAPLSSTIKRRILDYASACYYIVTAEDGETIIFWTKYYGVFPTDIPSAQMTWSAGNVIKEQTMDVNFVYSFKRDYHPYTLLEFNYNARMSDNSAVYAPIYDDKLLTSTNFSVGAPYIETVRNADGKIPVEFKLRFRTGTTEESPINKKEKYWINNKYRLYNTARGKRPPSKIIEPSILRNMRSKGRRR